MKTLLIILSILFCGCANAQLKTLELNHGKYLENSIKNDFVGNWKSKDNSFKINVTTEKKHVKRNAIDVYVDFLTVKITHFVSNGKQIANSFKSDLSLLSIGNNNFNGTYRDPLSGNNIKINLKYINNTELLFTTKLPEIDFTNHPEKGTVFPEKFNLIKE